jgi:hypothetical protein
MGMGSSSPARSQSHASLSSAPLPPTDENTVLRPTPARSATASMVVAAYPRSMNSSAAAVTIARRVARAWLARTTEEYVEGAPSPALSTALSTAGPGRSRAPPM